MKKQDIRIDFVNFVEAPDESISYPLGILYISANLKQQDFTNIGFTEHICLLRKLNGKEAINPYSFYTKDRYKELQKDNKEKVLKYLEKRTPQILLLGPITSYHLLELQPFVNNVKELIPDIIIMAGGPHFGKELNLDTEYISRSKGIDALILGEAEETVVELVSLFYKMNTRKGQFSKEEFIKKLGEINGVLTKNNQYKPRNAPDLTKLPLPDIKLLDNYWNSDHVSFSYIYKLSTRRNPVVYTDYGYFQGESDWGYIEDDFHHFSTPWNRFPYGIVIGSRGCPGKCTFCCSQGPRRTHTAEKIMKLIRYMNEKHQTCVFVFFESLFTTISTHELNRIEELCTLIIDSGLRINFMVDIRADVLTRLPEEILDLMLQAGCKEFNIGFEKGSDKALQLIKKGTTVKEQKTAVSKIRASATHNQKSIMVNGTFILGGPSETKQDVEDTMLHSWLLHLDNVSVYPIEVTPGTELYRTVLNEGAIESGLAPYLDIENFPTYETDEVSREYMRSIVNSNSEARKNHSDFVKTLNELEVKFTPDFHDISNIIPRETMRIRELFWVYIDTVINDKENTSKAVQKIIDEINQVESRLVHQRQYSGEELNDIQFGWTKGQLERCISAVESLLKQLELM